MAEELNSQNPIAGSDLLATLAKLDQMRLWDEQPVFCFTSDIDWASEDVLDSFLSQICHRELKLTVFVTHDSSHIRTYYERGLLDRGLHPNFLPGSSHGDSFREVAETCVQYAPEARGFRCHRLFDVTDVTHLLHDDYGFRYVSNLGTIMQSRIRPILHESGLLHFPIFFEDGSHLMSGLPLDISSFQTRFCAPGIKIISTHPLDFVLNTPYIAYTRQIKDSMSRDQYQSITGSRLAELQNEGVGVRTLVEQIVDLAQRFQIMSLDELYRHALE